MELQEYKDLLLDTAGEVEKLIAKKKNKDYFLEQVSEFEGRFYKWLDFFMANRKRALKDKKYFVGRVPDFYFDIDKNGFPIEKSIEKSEIQQSKWFNKVKKDKPEPGLILMGYDGDYADVLDRCYPLSRTEEIPEVNGLYWSEPEPLNPLDTLCFRDESKTIPPYQEDFCQRKGEEIEQREDELRKFYLLAVIHANFNIYRPMIDKNKTPAKAVWDIFGMTTPGVYDNWYNTCGKEIISLVKNALFFVKEAIKNAAQAGPANSFSRLTQQKIDVLSNWHEQIASDYEGAIDKNSLPQLETTLAEIKKRTVPKLRKDDWKTKADELEKAVTAFQGYIKSNPKGQAFEYKMKVIQIVGVLNTVRDSMPEENKGQVLSKEMDNVRIEKTKTHWEFYYHGEKAVLDLKLKGLKIIELLITNPHKTYACCDVLIDIGEKCVGDNQDNTKMLENLDLIEIKKARDTLKEKLNNEYDPVIKAENKEELRKLEKYIKSSSNLLGKPRRLEDKDRKRILKNYNTVLGKIQSAGADKLYSHFKKFLAIGENCIYSPDTEIFWEISKNT